MFGLGNNSKVKGHGFVVLNILRGFNIIGLAGMATSNMVLSVKGAMNGSFTGFGFFALVSGLLTSFFSLFLLFSEIDLGKIKSFFHAYFPVLSTTHSLGWLGMVMVFLGVDLLGNLNSAEYAWNNLGLPFWRLCLASAVLCVTFGTFNVFSTLVFREHDSPVTDRLIRSDGSLAEAKQVVDDGSYYQYSATTACNTSTYDEEKTQEQQQQQHGFKKLSRFFGRGEDAARLKISHPIAFSHEGGAGIERQPTGDSSNSWSEDKEDRSSPVLPHIQRPPTAMHPLNRSTSSRYSVVSNMTRF